MTEGLCKSPSSVIQIRRKTKLKDDCTIFRID